MLTQSEHPRLRDSLLYGAFSSLLAFVIAHKYFAGQFEMAVSGFAALSLCQHFGNLLSQNRSLIWDQKMSPWFANRLFVSHLLIIFLCLFFAGVLHQLLTQGGAQASPQDLSLRYSNSLLPLLKNNLYVVVNCFLISALIRSGGVILVLSWNAIHWAQSLALMFSTKLGASAFGGLLAAAAITPHLVLEVVAYVLAGLGGTFLSTACLKYSLGSRELYRVSLACLTMAVVAALCCCLAALVEVKFAQWVIANWS